MYPTDKVYIVTRVYISASDCNSNGYSECEVYTEKANARKLFDKWKMEELNQRKETGCYYEIYADNDEKFHCAWDSDLEMLIITLHEKTINPTI